MPLADAASVKSQHSEGRHSAEAILALRESEHGHTAHALECPGSTRLKRTGFLKRNRNRISAHPDDPADCHPHVQQTHRREHTPSVGRITDDGCHRIHTGIERFPPDRFGDPTGPQRNAPQVAAELPKVLANIEAAIVAAHSGWLERSQARVPLKSAPPPITFSAFDQDGCGGQHGASWAEDSEHTSGMSRRRRSDGCRLPVVTLVQYQAAASSSAARA